MKVIYNGPCKEVTVPGYGIFKRGASVDIDEGKAKALEKTNVNFKTVGTKSEKKAKSNAKVKQDG